MSEKKLFDAIFRKAVEWMANCPEGDSRGVVKSVGKTYVVLHVTYVQTTTMRIRFYDLMLLMNGEFALNNGKGEYVPCADPMGAFDDYCNNEWATAAEVEVYSALGSNSPGGVMKHTPAF